METYRVVLEVRSRLATPLAADTLWGHVAWGIRWRNGEPALVEWLAAFEAGQPPLVLSDPMPAGYFPRPALPRDPPPDSRPSDEDHDARKRLDGLAWVSHRDWASCGSRLSLASLRATLLSRPRGEPTPAPLVPGATMHAGINRYSGGTAQEGGGLLFSSDEYFPGQVDVWYDVWAASPAGREQVAGWLAGALEGGYGRDSATGAGDVRIVSVEQESLPSIDGANAGVLLGPATPAPGDSTAGFFNLGVRAGRLGGDFAVGSTPSGSAERQKRPVHCLLRGSVIVGGPPRQTFGRVVAGVHEDPAIRHYAMSLLLPCRLESDTLREAES